MILTKSQNKIAEDTHRFRVINCGRRFGKTTLAIEEIKGVALAKETRICYIAPTIQQARDIAWEMMMKELKPVIVKAVESPSREIVIKNIKGTKSLIQLSSWEKIETLRGQRFDFIVIDEVASMRNFWLNWQEVIRPTLTDTKGEVMFISTPKGFNHFYDLYNLENEDKDYKSFHFTSYDNPFLPVDELDKAKEELTENRFAQEYLADFKKTEGLVYKEFSREKNVSTQTPTNITETIIGIDFGYTNPAAIIPIRIDGDSHCWIGEEWYRTRQTTDQIAEQASLYKSTKCYPDPAEPDRIEILRKAGLNVREVSKDIVAGIDHVRELFKQNRIHIHPDCKNLIMELETYRYPDKKPDQNEQEKPIAENNHAVDALRYALYTNKPEIPEPRDIVFETFGTHYRD
jgi:PBSX family phage terminase large subunit